MCVCTCMRVRLHARLYPCVAATGHLGIHSSRTSCLVLMKRLPLLRPQKLHTLSWRVGSPTGPGLSDQFWARGAGMPASASRCKAGWHTPPPLAPVCAGSLLRKHLSELPALKSLFLCDYFHGNRHIYSRKQKKLP